MLKILDARALAKKSAMSAAFLSKYSCDFIRLPTNRTGLLSGMKPVSVSTSSMAGMTSNSTPSGRTISSSIFSAASVSVTTPASVKPRASKISTAFIACVRWPVPLPQKATTKRFDSTLSDSSFFIALTEPSTGPLIAQPMRHLLPAANGGLKQSGGAQASGLKLAHPSWPGGAQPNICP